LPVYAQDNCTVITEELQYLDPEPAPGTTDCLDVEATLTTCEPFYIKTNVHFFLNESIAISPNPSSNFINIDFDAKDTGLLKIYGMHNNSNSSYGVVNETSVATQDQQSINLDISNWMSGSNSLIFDFKGEIFVKTIIKQ